MITDETSKHFTSIQNGQPSLDGFFDKQSDDRHSVSVTFVLPSHFERKT